MLRHFLSQCIDLLFPPSEDLRLVRTITEENVVQSCGERRLVHGITTLASFSNKRVRSLVHEAKFHHNRHAQKMLSIILREYLSTLPHQDYVLLPVPLSRHRMRERGFNQVEEVATLAVLKLAHIRVQSSSVTKWKDTPPQSSLKREMRLKNMLDAFRLNNSQYIKGASVILLDDVMTTGATLRELEKVVRAAKPRKVLLISLAH